MYAGFAGVFKTEFDDLLLAPDFDVMDWSAASGTWVMDTSAASGTPSGNDVDVLWWDGDTPTSYTAEIELKAGDTDGPWTVAFRGDGSENYYLARIESGQAAFYKVEYGVLSLLSSFDIDIDISAPGTMRLAVREMSFSTYEYDRWLFMSLWLDDHFLGMTGDNIADDQPDVRFGLAVMNGDTLTAYSGVRIPDLAASVPYATLDPDETASSAISRALADRVVRSIVRYNGALSSWRPKAASVASTFSRTLQANVKYKRDIRELINHVRLYYLLDWVEAFDQDSLGQYGHRFREISSAVIESEAEAYQEALNIMRWSQESAFGASLNALAGGLFLEPEDRVTFPDDTDYFIDSLQWEYKGHRLYVTIDGRQYSYDE
jgi:hypothetical protein